VTYITYIKCDHAIQQSCIKFTLYRPDDTNLSY